MEIVLQSRVVVLGFPLHQSRHSCWPSRVCFGWKGLWGLPLHRWPQPAAFLGEGLAGERAGPEAGRLSVARFPVWHYRGGDKNPGSRPSLPASPLVNFALREAAVAAICSSSCSLYVSDI